MELRPHPARPDFAELSFDTYREYMTLRDLTLKAFSGWVLRTLHLQPPMEFPYVETVSREKLVQDAAQLRKDANYVIEHNHPQAPEISSFRNGMAEQIENYLGQVA